MYSRKRVGPRMVPWVTPALTRCSCKNLLSRTIHSCLLLRKDEKRPNTLIKNSIRVEFVKNINTSHPVQSLGYIKYHNSNKPRPIKNSGNSVRYNCQRICSWLRKPKTMLKIRKRGLISQGNQQAYYLQFFSKISLITERTLTGL